MNEIIKKNGITFGIITGAISVLITTSIYLINFELFTSMWIGFTKISLYIVIAIILLVNTKKQLNNVFTFKDAFTTYFLSSVLGITLATIFEIVLFNLIDPAAKETIMNLSIEAAVDMMKKFNTPTSAIKEAVIKMGEKNQFDAIELIKGSLSIILLSAVFGLILAAIFKSKPTYQE